MLGWTGSSLEREAVALARKSNINRDQKRQRLYEKHKAKRAELKQQLLNTDDPGEKIRINIQLQKLPRNSSPTRLKNRCAVTGRSRGYMRKFGLSRIQFREDASLGLLPGVRKSSW